MKNSQDNEKHKQPMPKGRGARSSKTQESPGQAEIKIRKGRTFQGDSTSSPTQRVLTHDEFRAHVSRKAFELYEQRRAITEVDDWVEAERLVKLQLLSEEQNAGSV